MQFSFRGEKKHGQGRHPRLGVAGRFYSITTRNKPNDNFSLSHVLASLPTLKIEALPVHPVFSQR